VHLKEAVLGEKRDDAEQRIIAGTGSSPDRYRYQETCRPTSDSQPFSKKLMTVQFFGRARGSRRDPKK